MSQVFRLPDLGEGLTEAEIVQWRVAVGDEVTVDQEVVTVETAKAAVDVPCPYAGAVAELHGAPGESLEVGAPLITITPAQATPSGPNAPADAPELAGAEQYRTEERAGAADPTASSDAPERPLIGYGAGGGPARRIRTRSRARSARPQSAGIEAPATTSVRDNGAVKVISPLVRKLATDAGLDLAAIRPSGPAGVIRRADVEAALGVSAKPGADSHQRPNPGVGEGVDERERRGEREPRDEHRIPISGVRKAIADKLSTSRREIPDATTWVDVDATELIAAKDALRRARPDNRIGVLALMARITVAGLQRYPALNSSVDLAAAEIVQHGRINLGFAAQSPRGLVVPVVHAADTMSTAELAAALHELTALAREGKVSPAQLTGGTFTLNNYGVFGVDGSTPIINHPEAAMLGVGRIIDRPWAHEGQLALRKVTQLSFTFDHRVCDGGTAGGFLRYVADCVEQPAVLLADS